MRQHRGYRGYETIHSSGTLATVIRESSWPARSVSACQAKCALDRLPIPVTKPDAPARQLRAIISTNRGRCATR
jgi:hypothetical protein